MPCLQRLQHEPLSGGVSLREASVPVSYANVDLAKWISSYPAL